MKVFVQKITLWFRVRVRVVGMIIMVKSRDQANSVANKSEYIREGYALKKSVKGLRNKKQKKGN